MTAAWNWFAGHVLGGLVVAAIVSASHFRLKKHVTKVAAEQTRALRGSSEEEP